VSFCILYRCNHAPILPNGLLRLIMCTYTYCRTEYTLHQHVTSYASKLSPNTPWIHRQLYLHVFLTQRLQTPWRGISEGQTVNWDLWRLITIELWGVISEGQTVKGNLWGVICQGYFVKGNCSRVIGSYCQFVKGNSSINMCTNVGKGNLRRYKWLRVICEG
jgi:hypothetical protein